MGRTHSKQESVRHRKAIVSEGDNGNKDKAVYSNNDDEYHNDDDDNNKNNTSNNDYK